MINIIISIIAALVMMLNSVSGMTATMEEPVTLESSVSMNEDLMKKIPLINSAKYADETTAGLMAEILKVMRIKAVMDKNTLELDLMAEILKIVKIRAVMDKNTLELDLMAEDDPMLTLGIRREEDESLVASSLLGHYVVTVSPDMAEQLAARAARSMGSGIAGLNLTGATAALQGMDTEQVIQDMTDIGEKFLAGVQEKAGEPQTGEYTVDGMNFTTRTPVHMDFEELAVLGLTCAKDACSKEYVTAVIQRIGTDMDLAAKLDQMIEKVEQMPEEDQFEMNAAIYSNGDDSAYVSATLQRDAKTVTAFAEDSGEETELEVRQDQDIRIGIGRAEGLYRMKVSVDAEDKGTLFANFVSDGESVDLQLKLRALNMNMAVTAKGDQENLDMTVSGIRAGQPVSANINVRKSGELEGEVNMELFMDTEETPALTLKAAVSRDGIFESDFSGKKTHTIPIETFVDENGYINQLVAVTAYASLLTSLTTLSEHLPAEYSRALTKLVGRIITKK